MEHKFKIGELVRFKSLRDYTNNTQIPIEHREKTYKIKALASIVGEPAYDIGLDDYGLLFEIRFNKINSLKTLLS